MSFYDSVGKFISAYSKRSTRIEYEIVLRHWVSVFGNKELDKLPNNYIELITDYVNTHSSSRNTNSYVYRHLQILSLYLKWLENKRYKINLKSSDINNYMKIYRNKFNIVINNKYADYIAEIDINNISLNTPINDMDLYISEQRKYSLLLIAYECGLKTHELTDLKFGEVLENKGILICNRSSGKVMIKLSINTSDIIRRYKSSIKRLYPRFKSDNPLFFGSNAFSENTTKAEKLTSRSLQRIIKKTQIELGIIEPFKLKDLRANAIIEDIVAEMTVKQLNRKYGFSGITAYQQYLPAALERIGINEFIALNEFAKDNNVDVNQLRYFTARNKKISFIKFRGVYYFEPSKSNLNTIKPIIDKLTFTTS